MTLAELITPLGDSALLVPAFLGLGAYLAAQGDRRLFAGFMAAAACCCAATLSGKLAFQACDALGAGLDIRSPSGHAAMSGTFYGGLAIAAGRGRPTWARSALLGLAMALAAAIGWSRVALGAHTQAEVFAGLAIAAGCLVVMRRVAGPQGARLRLHAAAYALCLAAIALHGQRLTPEGEIRRVAQWISNRGLSCPYPRTPEAHRAGLPAGMERLAGIR